jgi:hypothetical protein
MSLIGLAGYASDSQSDSEAVDAPLVLQAEKAVVPPPGDADADALAPAAGGGCGLASRQLALRQKLLHLFENKERQYDPSVAERSAKSITSFLEMNDDLTEKIRGKKDFGNPYILQKVVDYYKIDEIGSNYPTHLLDPHGYPEEDFEEHVRRSMVAAAPAAALPPAATAPPLPLPLPLAAPLPPPPAIVLPSMRVDSAVAVAVPNPIGNAAAAAQAIALRQSLSMSNIAATTSVSATTISTIASSLPTSAALDEPNPPRKKSRWD